MDKKGKFSGKNKQKTEPVCNPAHVACPVSQRKSRNKSVAQCPASSATACSLIHVKSALCSIHPACGVLDCNHWSHLPHCVVKSG